VGLCVQDRVTVQASEVQDKMTTYKQKYIEAKHDYDSLSEKFGKLIQEIINLNKKILELQKRNKD